MVVVGDENFAKERCSIADRWVKSRVIACYRLQKGMLIYGH